MKKTDSQKPLFITVNVYKGKKKSHSTAFYFLSQMYLTVEADLPVISHIHLFLSALNSSVISCTSVIFFFSSSQTFQNIEVASSPPWTATQRANTRAFTHGARLPCVTLKG